MQSDAPVPEARAPRGLKIAGIIAVLIALAVVVAR